MSVTTEVSPYRMFSARLAARRRLSPRLVRLTLAGPSLTAFADRGYDQRIKLVLPQPGGLPLDAFPGGPDWWTVWRDQPIEGRAHLRTYTVAAARPEAGEIDVDFVDHGVTGPGSRFAIEAAPGDPLIVFGPNADFDGEAGGLEFRREFTHTSRQLVVGDLSALPAVNGITRRLTAAATGLVCVEVPYEEDAQGVQAPPGVELAWCVTDRGDDQLRTVRDWLTAIGPLTGDQADTTVFYNGEDDAYWEVSATDAERTAPALSAWIAGESGRVRALRRLLVNDFDIPRAAVCFMGYWRIGVAGS